MENENIEMETLQTESEMETPQTPEAEQPEKSKELQSAIAQKEHFKKKFEDSQKTIEELRRDPKFSNQVSSMDTMQAVRLSKALQGFSEEETDFILRNTPGKTPEEIIKASQDEWVKDAIQARRAKAAAQNKVPSPGSSSPFANTVKSPQDVNAMLEGKSKEEQSRLMQEYEAKVVKEMRAKGI